MSGEVRRVSLDSRHAPTPQPHIPWGRCGVRCCKTPYKCAKDYTCQCHEAARNA